MRERWWSVHSWAFLPVPAFAFAVLLVATGLLFAWRAPAALDRQLVRGLPKLAPLPGWTGRVLAVVLAGVAFWLFREGHTLLGDGNALIRNIVAGQDFHPDEPLTVALHRFFFVTLGGLFAGDGRPPAEVAQATVGLSSVVCGALFVPIAWALSGDLLRAGAADSAGTRGAPRAEQVLVFAVLLAQGYVQVLFGYVENYGFLTLALAAYGLAALRALEGRAPLVLPGALLLLALAFHLSAATVCLLEPRSRVGAMRDLVLLAALALVGQVLFARYAPDYDWLGTIVTLGGRPYFPPSAGQFVQQQLQIGPLALALLLVASVAALALREWRHGRSLLLASLVPGYLVASYLAGDSNLGQARNWDLLAPAGFLFTLVALGLALRAAWPAAGLRRWLFVLAIASLFHTVPWIAVNASAERTIERFKVLPLGLGRGKVVVADWYYARGQEDEALGWYRLALDENPLQNHAHSQLGRIALHRGRYDIAEVAFREALRSRPTMALYRFQLVDALVRSGQLAPARTQLDTLLALEPGVAGYRAASAVVWFGLGYRDSASASLDAAERLAPGDTLAPLLRATIERDTPAAEVVREVWPKLVQY
jgi:tetratricopeptide (TPR) repeat protein